MRVSKKTLKTISELEQLPFIATRDGVTLPKHKKGERGRCFWHVKPSGDYEKDNNTGYAFALQYLQYEERQNSGTLLPLIVMDMPRELCGVVVGFLTLVGFAANHGAERAREIAAYWQERAREAEEQPKKKRRAA